jgi:hypothetical protein
MKCLIEQLLDYCYVNIDDSDQGYESHNGRSRVTSIKASSVAEAVAKPISLRSRHREEREAFDAQKNAGAEKTRLENLKARLTARRESTTEHSSAHRSTIRDGDNEHFMKKNRSAAKSKARRPGSKVGKHGIASGRQVSLDASDSLRNSVSIHQTQLPMMPQLPYLDAGNTHRKSNLPPISTMTFSRICQEERNQNLIDKTKNVERKMVKRRGTSKENVSSKKQQKAAIPSAMMRSKSALMHI